MTHGHVASMVRWLNEQGIAASGLQTEFEGEQDAEDSMLEEAVVDSQLDK